LKRRANLTAPLRGEQTMPFDSKGLQFANSSLNLPKHEDFNSAFLTAQDATGLSTRSSRKAWKIRSTKGAGATTTPPPLHFLS